MKYKLLIPVVLGLFLSLTSNCKPGNKEPLTQDTTKTTQDFTITQKQDTTANQNNEKVDPPLKGYLKYMHEQWDKVPSSFEAKYMGFDIGDYPHIMFRDKKGNEYDFGDGENSFGSFKEEDFLADKSKYEGKMFKLTWEWKTSSFYCCDGEMDIHTGKVPSIVDLGLVK